jgi:hypothetical protein
VRRLRYRDEVMEHLGALLLMYPRRRQFADDFPEIPAAIRGAFESGTRPSSAALTMASGIITGLLGQLPKEQRDAVRQGLVTVGTDSVKDLASRRLARDSGRTVEPVAFATELTAVATWMAQRMADEGTLGREDVASLRAAIAEALGC